MPSRLGGGHAGLTVRLIVCADADDADAVGADRLLETARSSAAEVLGDLLGALGDDVIDAQDLGCVQLTPDARVPLAHHAQSDDRRSDFPVHLHAPYSFGFAA